MQFAICYQRNGDADFYNHGVALPHYVRGLNIADRRQYPEGSVRTYINNSYINVQGEHDFIMERVTMFTYTIDLSGDGDLDKTAYP